MLKTSRRMTVLFALVGLGACQSTLGSGAVSKIAAAGYQPVNTGITSIGPVSGIATYVCTVSRCGSASAISVNTIQGNSNAAGETLEAQARKSGATQADVRKRFASNFNTSSGSRTATSIRLYSTTSHAGLWVNGVGKTNDGKKAHFAGRVAFRGNTGTTVIGVGGTPATAQKAMTLAIED